jgi:glycogen debranching enzyme
MSFSASCEAVLRANDKGHYTIPSPKLYPHQWAWDSAFAAIGWAHIDPTRGWLELDTLMAGQWDDGRVPHIYFHVLSDDYFPGPEFWQTTRSSSISQPPIWATAARRLHGIEANKETLTRLLPRFEASHRFFHEQRDPNNYGLVAVAHPWESGLDNSPAWDAPMSRVDVSNPPAFRRKDQETTGDASVRPTDDHYLRYACLVKAIAEDGFGPGPFAVYDPMFSAILCRAEEDLAWLAAQCGFETEAASRAERIREGLQRHLWDADLGRFVYYDARADERITMDVIGAYLPLYCGIDEACAARPRQGIRERFSTSWPLPSCAPSSPAFDARRYWRGPTWININWLLADSVETIADRSLALMRKHGFREYYQPETGDGLGAENFTWSAALALDMLRR